jgi:hypothetical protein
MLAALTGSDTGRWTITIIITIVRPIIEPIVRAGGHGDHNVLCQQVHLVTKAMGTCSGDMASKMP